LEFKQKMSDTYTYSARNVDNPDVVVTFTLENDHLRLSLTGLLEQAGKVPTSEDKLADIKEQFKNQAMPGTIKLLETITGPIHVGDLAVHSNGEYLALKAWQRVGGLRLAPLKIDMGRVDNPPAAKAFVAELKSRQKAAAHAGRFFGPLDYWVGWAALFFGVVLLLRWPRKKH
jgi:hypothetical protein